METVEARREKYLEMLLQMIEIVEHADDVPSCAFIQVVWSSGEVTRMKQLEIGVNRLTIAGLFHALAHEATSEVMRHREES